MLHALGPPCLTANVSRRTRMNLARLGKACQIAGVVAIVSAPVPFLVVLYQGVTTKILDMEQDKLIYQHERYVAWQTIAVGGLCLGLVLVCMGALLKRQSRRASA